MVKWLARIALLLAFIVVILGAFTRLSDAGLGCPDWPGCYGHFYPEHVIDPAKAWAEMIHRYAAGTLGLLILCIAIGSLIKRKALSVAVPLALVVLVIFQAALGMWTVTLQLLPVVVMGHLLGGMTIFALLGVLNFQLGRHFQSNTIGSIKVFRPWALIGLIIVACQIALGGWTSANYAALACTTFPFCHGQLLPIHEFHAAFNFFMPVGANFQGGVLDGAERVTIQVMHRLGALITALYLVWLSVWLLISGKTKALRILGTLIIIILCAQILLGILNVVLLLPLGVAVAHNAVAALLLLTVVALNCSLYVKRFA